MSHLHFVQKRFHMGAQKTKDQVQRLLNVLAFQGDKVGYPRYDIKSLESQKVG
jgi:hypothetical protein